jgi:hypothetical protein
MIDEMGANTKITMAKLQNEINEERMKFRLGVLRAMTLIKKTSKNAGENEAVGLKKAEAFSEDAKERLKKILMHSTLLTL